MPTKRLAVAAAVNDRAVLDQCLASSPDIKAGAIALRTYEGYSSASIAYNKALEECDAEILIFAHQDVYLPSQFAAKVDKALGELDRVQPEWAVAGVVGVDSDDALHGRSWSTGLRAVIGSNSSLPAPVETLDEMVLILRTSSGLRFDEQLPGFHLYAADIIQMAASAGRSTWVIDAPAIHHSRPVLSLGGSYTEAWRYMRRKWRDRLPIPNLVCPLTRSRWTLWRNHLRIRLKYRRHKERRPPPMDPALIAERLGYGD